MPKGTLVDAGVRIGFGYKDARRSGISGFGEPSKRQKLAEEEAKAKAEQKLARRLEKLQRLPGLRMAAAKLRRDGLTDWDVVRQLEREERARRLPVEERGTR